VKLVADTDSLTGLANRRAFLRSLARKAGQLPRSGGGLSLAVVDLDGFKPINDTFGHATGDSVLKEVGARLSRAAGASALVARTGGDEFALLLPDSRSPAAAKSMGAAICATLQDPFVIEGREFRLSGCCGLALLSAEQCEVTESLIQADTALYRAKQEGRGASRRVHARNARPESPPRPDREGAAPARDAGVDRPRLPADPRPRDRRAQGVRGAGALGA
jgi:diguanylate cyclase (GGDEF)-like protein